MINTKATVSFDSEETLIKKARNAILAGAQQKAATMKCNEHEQSATVALDGDRSFRISACCEPFASEVRQAIFKK